MSTSTVAAMHPDPHDNQPSQDLNLTSLTRFAKFFKTYMAVMPVFMAALAPVLTLAKTIPVYDQQNKSLATYTGILGFLMVAWVFYLRHPIARLTLIGESSDAKFYKKWLDWLPSRSQALRGMMYVLPVVLICASAYCFVTYNLTIDSSISVTRLLKIRQLQIRNTGKSTLTFPMQDPEDSLIQFFSTQSELSNIPTVSEALADSTLPVPNSLRLTLYYLGIFLFAELAFFVMALREYLQSLLTISDQALIKGLKQSGIDTSSAGIFSKETISDPKSDDSLTKVQSSTDIESFVARLRAANLITKF